MFRLAILMFANARELASTNELKRPSGPLCSRTNAV